MLGSRERFLNRNETLGHLFRTAGGFCERTEESRVTVEKPGLTKVIKSAAEKRHPSDEITTLDRQYCFEGMP